MDPSHPYYQASTALASSTNYYYPTVSPVLPTTMSTEHILDHKEPNEWEIEITKAKRECAKAKALLKSADEDLNSDANDNTANNIKTESQHIINRSPVVLRYLEAMLKWSKDKVSGNLSSTKMEESRCAAETCKKVLNDYDKAEGNDGNDGKDIKKE